MNRFDWEDDAEYCIRAEMKTLYPQEHKRIYKFLDAEDISDDFSLDLCLSIKTNLYSLLRHLNSKTSISDLVGDKTSEQMCLIKDIRHLCEEIHNRIDKIYETY